MSNPQLKIKVLPRFPSSVSVTAPMLLSTTGGNYSLSLDMNSLIAQVSAGVVIPANLSVGVGTGTSLTLSGTTTATFAVGSSFQVDNSTASVAAGWKVKGSVTGGVAALSVFDSGTNSAGSINSKGSGTLNLQDTATGYVKIGSQLVIGGTPAEADPMWVGGNLSLNNIGAVKVSGSFNATVSHVALAWFEPSFIASGVVTDYGTVRINNGNFSGGGTVDKFYQLRIQAPTGGTSVNQSIYTEGSGKVGFGTSAAQAHLHVNENTVQNITPPNGTLLYFSAADNSTAQVVYDSFGNSSALSQLILRRSQGTAASPTHILSGDVVGTMASQGYDGSAYTSSTASVSFIAGADWTNGPSHNTFIQFGTTPTGGNFVSEFARIWGSGGLAVGTATTDPGAGGLALHPGSSVTPASNGDLVVQATSNTSLTFKYKGSDGTVRSGSITLS